MTLSHPLFLNQNLSTQQSVRVNLCDLKGGPISWRCHVRQIVCNSPGHPYREYAPASEKYRGNCVYHRVVVDRTSYLVPPPQQYSCTSLRFNPVCYFGLVSSPTFVPAVPSRRLPVSNATNWRFLLLTKYSRSCARYCFQRSRDACRWISITMTEMLLMSLRNGVELLHQLPKEPVGP